MTCRGLGNATIIGGFVMRFRHALLAASLFCTPALAFAHDAVAAAMEQGGEAQSVTVAAGLSVPLALTGEISSSRNRLGETIGMVVTSDVVSNGIVVIPQGTRAVGEISFRSGRGMFGKSGKLEISFRYVDMDGVRVPLDGAHFQAGDGNTVGTIGAIVAAGVVGGMVVTGRSANVSEGSAFTARTIDPLPMIVHAANPNGPARARLSPTYTPSPLQTGSAHRRSEEAAEASDSRGGPRPNESCSDYAHRRTANHNRAWRIEQECRRDRDRAQPIR